MMQGAPAVPPQGQKPPATPNSEPEAIRNLMVNYIPTTIDEVQLRQLFEMYGPIESVKIVCDRETRTSKGYGFVKYRFGFSAVHAIQYLNGYPLMNKRLKVAYSNQAEAQKAIISPQAESGNYSNQYGGNVSQPAGDEAWAQQLGYMQQIAALQMMQASYPPNLIQHHSHHRHHQHHAPQQPQQPQNPGDHHHHHHHHHQ